MLTEENSSHTQLVGSLSTEKESLQAKIDHLTAQIAEVGVEAFSGFYMLKAMKV